MDDVKKLLQSRKLGQGAADEWENIIGTCLLSFHCFLFTVEASFLQKCLRQDVEDLQLIVKELVYCASMVPLQCREQALLLVLDAVQLLPSPLKNQLTSKIRAAVSTQLKEFADVIRCLQEDLDCNLVS